MTARYCWASRIMGGGGEGENIFHNDIKVASSQHIQFAVLALVAHDSN